MAANQHAASFTVAAMAMAMASFMAIFSLVTANAAIFPGPFTILTIQNDFPVTNLTVQCHPDIELVRSNVTYSVLPKEAYEFGFSTRLHHQWNCTLSTPKTRGILCSHVKSGEFMMWENRSPPMCDHQCRWFAGPDGLSLVKHLGADPVHVYDWPSHPNAAHNCRT